MGPRRRAPPGAAAAGTALPGPAAPAVGFEVPLEMLSACHGRVQAQCDTLLRLVPHVAAHGADRAAREAAGAVMRYFDSAARHHHEDEEQDLFPALLSAAAGPATATATPVVTLVEALCADHRALEAGWLTLRAALWRLASGEAGQLDDATVRGFVAAYARHIAREEAELLPLAARRLDVATLDRIGLAMRARRGLA